MPGGHGARAGSEEGRRAGAPEKRPDFLPARARKPESGRRARDRRARPRAPRRSPPRADTRYTVPGPARPPPPSAAGGGAGWGPGAEGLPGGGCPVNLQSPFSGLGFLICQREQRENPARWRTPVIPEIGKRRQKDCLEFEVSLGDLA